MSLILGEALAVGSDVTGFVDARLRVGPFWRRWNAGTDRVGTAAGIVRRGLGSGIGGLHITILEGLSR